MVTNGFVVVVMSAVTCAFGGVAFARPPMPDHVAESTPDAGDGGNAGDGSDASDDGGADDNDSSPAFNMLGFRMSIGALPVGSARATTFALGVGVEHPALGKTRVFGEGEWLWLMHQDEREMDSVAIRPERHGNGPRVSAGLRREMLAKNAGRSVRMFIDAELGGGVAMTNDNAVGFAVVPAALVGLRLGYDLYSRADSSPSQMFEAELVVRAMVVRDGVGFMTGVGMAWGN